MVKEIASERANQIKKSGPEGPVAEQGRSEGCSEEAKGKRKHLVEDGRGKSQDAKGRGRADADDEGPVRGHEDESLYRRHIASSEERKRPGRKRKPRRPRKRRRRREAVPEHGTERLQKWEEEERQLWPTEVLVEAVPLIPGGMQGIPPTPRSGENEGASHGPEAPNQWVQSDGWVPHQYPNPHPKDWHEPPPTPRPQEWPEDDDRRSRSIAPHHVNRRRRPHAHRKWARPMTAHASNDQEVSRRRGRGQHKGIPLSSPPPCHPEAENPHPPKWTPARPPTPRHGQEVREEEPEEHIKEEGPRPGGGGEQWQYCRTEIPQAHVAHALNAFVAGGVQWRQHTVTWTWPVSDEAKATVGAETHSAGPSKSNQTGPQGAPRRRRVVAADTGDGGCPGERAMGVADTYGQPEGPNSSGRSPPQRHAAQWPGPHWCEWRPGRRADPGRTSPRRSGQLAYWSSRLTVPAVIPTSPATLAVIPISPAASAVIPISCAGYRAVGPKGATWNNATTSRAGRRRG
ncbi:serine/arginine repetitive matrix protein 1-like [Drosophila rhopaloa]|uniref:Serine/arginine repetitive matrix protein 1-like n=1 Tax=Drosophila rhopaloa TaxID=1041015 RepID=A0ABM5J3A3_DRORH|nr:serine/arginine repetitive matrix protein 1-like [Drosophila rhopaloa]